MKELEHREIELSNGMQVVMTKMDTIPVVVINNIFHIGAKDEKKGKTGISHLFEHLMFEGSPNIPRGKFDEILNENGGDSNAYTSWDVTSYHMQLPSSNLELGLWLDSDRLLGFNIDEESLEVQKKVVCEEKLQIHDNVPYGSVEEESSKRLFINNGYSSPIIGSVKDIESFTLKEIKDFYNIYYRPNNAVLSITGDIDYLETEKQVRKYYENITRGENIPERKFYDVGIEREITANILDDIHLGGKFIFYKIPELFSKEYYIFLIISGMLSTGESSRLKKKLLYEKELVNEIDSSVLGMEFVSLFNINAIALEGSSSEKILSYIDKEIVKIRKGEFNANEIEKSVNKIETDFLLKLNQILSVSDKISEIKILTGNCRKIKEEIDILKKITKEDILNVSNKYLINEKRVVLNYLPKNE